jgi:hypothetical protein
MNAGLVSSQPTANIMLIASGGGPLEEFRDWAFIGTATQIGPPIPVTARLLAPPSTRVHSSTLQHTGFHIPGHQAVPVDGRIPAYWGVLG